MHLGLLVISAQQNTSEITLNCTSLDQSSVLNQTMTETTSGLQFTKGFVRMNAHTRLSQFNESTGGWRLHRGRSRTSVNLFDLHRSWKHSRRQKPFTLLEIKHGALSQTSNALSLCLHCVNIINSKKLFSLTKTKLFREGSELVHCG